MDALRAAAFVHENACDCCNGSEGMDMDGLHDALRPDASEWLADAVCEAVCNGDLAFLVKQVERHVPGWVRP